MRKILKKINKTYLIKNNFKKYEKLNNFNRSFFKEFNTINEVHLNFARLNYNKSLSYSKLHLICFLSGRTRATIKKFMLSRMFLKKIGLNGYITGFKKASW